MTVGRRQVLSMLAAGQLSADEADRLIRALEHLEQLDQRQQPQTALERRPPVRTQPSHLRMQIGLREGGETPLKLEARLPLSIVRAGARLASLVPPEAQEQVSSLLRARGLPFDIGPITPDRADRLVDELSDLAVEIGQRRKDLKVKLSCE